MIAEPVHPAVRSRTSAPIGFLAAASLLLLAPAAAAPAAAAAGTTDAPAATGAGQAAVAPAATGAEQAATAPGPAAATAAPSPRQEELMIGDKVEVSFFEQLDLGLGSSAGAAADTRTFYQRLDLTGEHVVGADGRISIPLLGAFQVSGKTPEEAEAMIVSAYREVTGRSGEVDIAIKERKPVYVTGIVKAPGAYRFEPGMVVLQAVALAGGYDRGAEATARLIDAQRERERRAQAADRLQWLIAKRDRLIEQRDALMKGGQPSGKKTSLQNGSDAAAEGERRLRDIELAVFTGQENLQKARLETAKDQVERMQAALDLLDKQIEARGERLRMLQQVQGRGYSSIEILWNAQKEVSDLKMQRERLGAELAAAEQTVVQVEAERAGLVMDRRAEIERELAGLEQEIEQQQIVVDAATQMMAALETAASGARPGDPLKVTVLRRTPAGTRVIEAEETTDLFPGDVVRVDVAAGEGRIASKGTTLR